MHVSDWLVLGREQRQSLNLRHMYMDKYQPAFCIDNSTAISAPSCDWGRGGVSMVITSRTSCNSLFSALS